jgi:single-strand DNA-binding protein
MAYLNKVFLIGNLTRDPELRVTPKGTSICQFGLAVNRQFRDESGATRDETTFVDIEAWGKQGELVAKYLAKGNPCMVEGRLRLDAWESKTGEKRSKLKVVLDNVQFLSRGGGGSDASATSVAEGSGERENLERHSPAPRANRPAPPPADAINDDDVPF